jgi:hypothetical protein
LGEGLAGDFADGFDFVVGLALAALRFRTALAGAGSGLLAGVFFAGFFLEGFGFRGGMCRLFKRSEAGAGKDGKFPLSAGGGICSGFLPRGLDAPGSSR